jgi:hypothetical protein
LVFLVVVSENMIVYSLNKNISGDKILKDINSMIENFKKHNSATDILLVIDIKTISHDDNSLIPKLEYKSQ